MRKRSYVKPVLVSETFLPQEYVAACYDYTAIFKCSYGEQNLYSHGAPCATTYVDIKGQQASGHESGSKISVTIYDINLNGFDLGADDIGEGTIIPTIEWKSEDTVNNTGVYEHKGSGEITSTIIQDPTRPNHS